jgi:hypothetical protein
MSKTTFTLEDLKKSKVAAINQHVLATVEKKKKGSKYGNEKVFDEFGNEYDSKKERKRGRDLKLLLKVGEIGFLARQVEYQFQIKGGKIASYYADFVYTNNTGEIVVEDVKSEATRKLPVYRLKRKMMLAQHGIKIKEV